MCCKQWPLYFVSEECIPYSYSPHTMWVSVSTHVHLVQNTVFTCSSHSKEWHVVCSLPPAVEHQSVSASNSSCQSTWNATKQARRGRGGRKRRREKLREIEVEVEEEGGGGGGENERRAKKLWMNLPNVFLLKTDYNFPLQLPASLYPYHYFLPLHFLLV